MSVYNVTTPVPGDLWTQSYSWRSTVPGNQVYQVNRGNIVNRI